MTRTLYPRSDSISAKVVEPSDFEQMFSFIEDHISSGITVTAGSGLAVSISTGIIRLKGLICEVSSTETVSSLTASNTNYIYATLARDSNGEAESFSFTKSTSGTTPTDSLKIAKVTTNGSAVTAVSQTNLTDTLQYALLPTGTIQMYGGQYNNIPNGWLLCDGTAVSRSTYEKLFDIVGTQFGVGNGSSTFNLPDLRAKFPRGATNTANAGTTGGADSVTLTEAESGSPAHNHGITDPSHSHQIGSTTSSNAQSSNNYVQRQNYGRMDLGMTTGSSSTGISVNNSTATNAASAHENRPAFLELLYMIRI
jgi:microcystin-dependent protein